jgi:hypothetical protein
MHQQLRLRKFKVSGKKKKEEEDLLDWLINYTTKNLLSNVGNSTRRHNEEKNDADATKSLAD